MRRERGLDPAADELEQLLAERGNWLMGIAIALTGEHADAEDLLQAALERLLRNRRGGEGMSTDLEQLVREGLDRLAATAPAPTGLVARARRHLRRRRLAAGSAVSGLAAVVAVLAAVVGLGPRRAPMATPAPSAPSRPRWTPTWCSGTWKAPWPSRGGSCGPSRCPP